MSKKSRFREPFDKQHGKRAQPLLKSASQTLYCIHWPLKCQLSWKKSFLLTCKILGLLVNTLAADGKYHVLNIENLTIPIHMQLSQKKKTFSQFLPAFSKFRLILNILKKKMTLTDFVFPKLRTLKTWLNKCLKSPVSEDPSTSNMVKVPKHCWKLHHRPFIIFIGHRQRNFFRKSLSYWHAKSWDCLLTH